MTELGEWQSFFGLVRRRILVILGVPTIAVAATVLLSVYWVQPAYEASTVLWVVQTEGIALDSAQLLFHRNLATTYAEVAKTGHIANRVAAKLTTSGISGASLQTWIRVRQLQAPEMMVISVRHPDPAEAASLANTYAQVLIEEMRQVFKLTNLQVLEQALAPSKSITPGPATTGTIALVVGLICGIVLSILLDSQGTRRPLVPDK